MTINYRRRLLVPALALVLTLGVGVAYAAIPDASGVIHGCFKKSGGDDDGDGGKGSLRVIDADKGETCKKNEAAVNWNQKGLKGDPGAAGPQGAKGDKGEPGAAGVQGTQGPQGVKGDKGEPGAAGARGDKGEPGTAGAQGDPGLRGDKGDKGDKGDQGLQGVQGPQGPQGVKGDKGDPGAPGPPGSAGTPSCPAGTAFVARGNFCAETSLSNAANQLDAADQCSARLRELPSVSRAMYGYLNLAEYVWPGTEEIWTDDWIADDTVRTILIASILHPSPLGSANYAEPHRFFCVTTRA